MAQISVGRLNLFVGRRTETEEDRQNQAVRRSIVSVLEQYDDARRGFDYATETDVIDMYIYRMLAIENEYKHLIRNCREKN